MPTVTFVPSGRVVEVERGTTLYDAAIKAGLPVASSCSGDFVCGKCHMIILEGDDSLSPQTDSERKLLLREKQPETHRISCVTQVQGDTKVTTTYW